MKLKSKKGGLIIELESYIEKAFVRDTLGLKKTGDKITLVRNDNGFLETGEPSEFNHYATGTKVDIFKSED